MSRREAMAIALVNSALEGNPKAFSLFLKFLNKSGLLRKEQEPALRLTSMKNSN